MDSLIQHFAFLSNGKLEIEHTKWPIVSQSDISYKVKSDEMTNGRMIKKQKLGYISVSVMSWLDVSAMVWTLSDCNNHEIEKLLRSWIVGRLDKEISNAQINIARFKELQNIILPA